MMRWILIGLLLTLAEGAVMSYVGFARSDLLLDKIPTHWNIHMQPDAWAAPDDYGWYLLIAPGVMLLMVLLMGALPWLSPRNYEINRFADTFGFLITSLIVFFGWIGALLLWAGIVEDPPWWKECFVAGFFVLFAVMGNMIGKVQRNFWMGIRTPWTLASEAVWNRTHRVAAWLWVGAGVLGGILVFAGLPFWIALVVIIAAALWPVAYSLILYKSLEKQGKL